MTLPRRPLRPQDSAMAAALAIYDAGGAFDPWRLPRSEADRPLEVLVSPLLCGPDDLTAAESIFDPVPEELEAEIDRRRGQLALPFGKEA